MSQETGNTPPLAPLTPSDTQPVRAIRKAPRWRSILLSILGVIGLLVLGALGGYGSGIGERKAAQSSSISQQLMQQFQYALVDEQFGRYGVAKKRLEFIIQNGPTFPGAQNELAKVLVLMTIPTPAPTLPPTPTPDVRGEQSLFATAQQLIASGDWLNALNELDQLRKADPNFNTAQVDGMYYFGLRNYGVDLIQKQGNLEGGIYQLTLAERFAPLDNTASGLREGARAYIQAASFFGVDWGRTVSLFSQVYAGWPAMYDGSMNAAHRYQVALMRHGDQLFGQGNVCDASSEFQLAESIGQLDQMAARNARQAYDACNPPTEEPATAEPPTGVPPAETASP
jgi:tetratricopeptide (TPR) repeat protein